jgi:hypothetical protein
MNIVGQRVTSLSSSDSKVQFSENACGTNPNRNLDLNFLLENQTQLLDHIQ